VRVLDTAALVANRARLDERITAAGGDPERITVVAVTKGFGPEVARAAIDAGLLVLGENYAQELLTKVAALAGGPHPVWHFLGRLQTNKIRQLVPHVALWQSVDRPEVVREIAKRSPGASVLVQLNLSGEEHKGGCPVADTPALVGLARDEGLSVRGLMGVGPAGDPDTARPGFERLVALADALDLPVRSIGMSADLEVAVRAGSTMVRVGRDLFGERPPR
jgi:pyridoxal phosphate enzyme (YggS family)